MTEEQRNNSELLDELHSLGQQLATAVKSLWESEDSRKLRQELEAGFVELGSQVETAVKTAQESEAARQFGSQVRETVDKARESDVASQLEEGLVSGLHDLNEQIARMVGSSASQQSADPATEPPAEEPTTEADA